MSEHAELASYPKVYFNGIEVTKEIIEAGVNCWWGHDIVWPYDREEAAIIIRDILLSMLEASQSGRLINPAQEFVEH